MPRHRSSWGAFALAGAATVGVAASGHAQCRPPANSNEARLLAFYEAPIVFAIADAPFVPAAGSIALTGEVVGVPTPPLSIEHPGFCFPAKQEATHLSPVLPRLRLQIGLPAGFAIEGSYLPPVTVDNAEPNLGSLALSYARQLRAPLPGAGGPAVTMELRAHATLGHVRGQITCSRAALQQTDPGQPCFGTTPSEDTFYPQSAGGEGTLGASEGRLSVFAGGGYTALTPRFRVGFTDLHGATDHTLVEVDLNRGAVFGGVGVQILRALDASAEVYSEPADLTTWRLAARYRLR